MQQYSSFRTAVTRDTFLFSTLYLPMDSSSSKLLFPLVAVSSTIAVASLAILQTDRASRWSLSPARLMAKRRQEYSYYWKTAMQKSHLLLEYCLAGGQEQYNADPEINLKKCHYVSDNQDEQMELAKQIVSDNNSKSKSKYIPLKLGKDPNDPTEEYYLFLMKTTIKEDDSDEAAEPEFFQTPLVPFCKTLRQVFEKQITSTTLCFVADASSGKATILLEKLVQEAKTGVAVLSEPLWMIDLARLTEARIFTNEKLHTMLFALCRLEAWALREESKQSHTVLMTLPGQSTVATLLPMVQAVFPEDRHLFAYDGCTASVERGLCQQSQFRRGAIPTDLYTILYGMANNPIRHTTPLPSKSPLTKALRGLETALADLPVSHASIVEAWMSSVDSFLKLKDEESKNGYLPYVLRLDFFTSPLGNFQPQSASFWSLSSLLQYITGTRSRPVPEGIMDSAIEFLKDYVVADAAGAGAIANVTTTPLSAEQVKALENCVFQHKSILLGNKTLKDTVLPTQHWSLKQASRAGCSCCGPDPLDEEEEEEEAQRSNGITSNKIGGFNMNTPGAFAMALKSTTSTAVNTIQGPTSITPAVTPASAPKSTGYVDGKMSFAFDPTKFS